MADHDGPIPREAWVTIPGKEAKEPFMVRHPYYFGFFPAMGRLLAAHERIGPKFRALFRAIMFEQGALSRQEREMVAAVAAAAQDCFYCWQTHVEFLRTEGGRDELARAIRERRWLELASLSPRERALLELAEKLSANRTKMIEDDWEPLRELGFDDDACLELTHIVGIFNHLARLADGLGLKLDAETSNAARTGEVLRRPQGNDPTHSDQSLS